MTDKVTLVRGSTTVTLNGPDGPTEVNCLPQWTTALASNATRWSYRTCNQHVEQWLLSFPSLTAAQWNALRNFFYDTTEGPTNTFTYTHTNGASYTARFIDGSISAKRIDSATWSTQIRIELIEQNVS